MPLCGGAGELRVRAELDEAELQRMQAYSLLAALLARPPERALLDQLSGLRGDETPWGQALSALGAAAAMTTPEQAEREYNRLFVGLQRGELVPYASYYLTGFLHDRPLVVLRADMARLGIVRSPDVSEPEDHIAAILEIMAGLVAGHFGAPASPAEQQAFFERHLVPWAPRFFRDLERAEAAQLYRPVGIFGRLLMEIERDAFALAE